MRLTQKKNSIGFLPLEQYAKLTLFILEYIVPLGFNRCVRMCNSIVSRNTIPKSRRLGFNFLLIQNKSNILYHYKFEMGLLKDFI